jgi:SAM-dependent methyltransferase
MWKRFQEMPEGIRQTFYWPSETYMKYRPESTFQGRKVLNFGCGKTTYKSENVVNLDVYPHQGVNVVCTENKLPFENDTFDFIIANHVLEHVPNWFESFKEMARVVKPGGQIEVWIPPVSSDTSFTYRDHINRIGVHSFAGCGSFNRSGNNLSAAVEFQTLGDVSRLALQMKLRRPALKWWLMLAWPSLLAFFSDHLRNTVSEEGFFFRKK